VRRALIAAFATILAGAAILVPALPAAAHVVPSTTIALDVHQDDITAAITLPIADLRTASGISLPTTGAPGRSTASAVSAYIEQHFHVTTDDDEWAVTIADVDTADAEQWGTGAFPAVTATATLTPADPTDLRSFTIDYDAIIHQVITADIFVTLHRDWATGQLEATRSIGTISLDTVTGTVPPLPVDLDDGSLWQGFIGMVRAGMAHIADGTDHQLFLLTLLLPAPLLAARWRWGAAAAPRTALRRITAITIAFTIGHSITLALGTLGVPVPQQAVEAAIAASILVAAAHALRPLFPGREPLVAGAFGLVHGMAFSSTLSALDLSGAQLGLSLLGFNIGIEIMQLAVVAVTLPPLVVLARTTAYRPLRIVAAAITGVAAVGWLLDRVGAANAVGTAADGIGALSPYIAVALWLGAVATVLAGRRTGRDITRNGEQRTL